MEDKRVAAWRSWVAAWPVQALAWFAFAVGVAWVGFVGLIVIAGGTWAHVVYASRPIRDLCREVDLPIYHTREKIPADRYPADYAIHFMRGQDRHTDPESMIVTRLYAQGAFLPEAPLDGCGAVARV